MENNIHSEKELFTRIAAGDIYAYRTLFDLYYERLRFNALKLLKSDYWADEITQEVFLHLWDNRDSLVTIENPAGWLYRIVSNKCFDRVRRRELEVRVQYAIHSIQNSENTIQQHHHDLTLLQKLVKEAVGKLPEQQQRVYLLRQEEGFSYKEIGAILEISPHTVHNHLGRAIQSVRNYILAHADFSIVIIYFLLF